AYSFPRLEELANDGLIEWNEFGLQATKTGRHFIRNICNAFDLHYLRKDAVVNEMKYSKAI
ncbi:MAG TPA: coproporphyrinogen III oxidase, partial [Parafilimonas sp.]|nr:coproporphyrinogen III oxidase [Parafilimonas sp.]